MIRNKAIVVGSGIVGISTALALLKKNYSVTLLEKNERAVGASIRNFGMIWPIGQAHGELHHLALRSKALWEDWSEQAGFHLDRNGSIHLAYHPDEFEVLSEFYENEKEVRNIRLVNPVEAVNLSPAINRGNLAGGLFSADEGLVHPGEANKKLSSWLQSLPNCQIEYNSPVFSIEGNACFCPQKKYEADLIFVASGADIEFLFPDILRESGVKCQLQMMRTPPQPKGFKMGPSLCGGLTLLHYPAFGSLPSLQALKNRMSTEQADLLKLGIHVMAAQNQAGEVTIGDSHLYGNEFDPFISQDINEKILTYLKTFCSLPDQQIQHYWKGVYLKSKGSLPYFIHRVNPDCTLINGLGGAGMTLSPGLAEQLINSL